MGMWSYPYPGCRCVSDMHVYRPAEDSYLLAKYVAELVEGDVLDMGTGSGIQAVTAAGKPSVRSVVAVDINPHALVAARKMASDYEVGDMISIVESDLFSNINSSFDWIIFNTPYLPSEGEADELSWAGGPTGSEVIKRFLKDAPRFLNPNGSILMLYSSLTNIVEDDFTKYNFEVLEEKSLFFEKLICVRLSPS